jgi:hypothetical protein
MAARRRALRLKLVNQGYGSDRSFRETAPFRLIRAVDRCASKFTYGKIPDRFT